MAEKKCSRCNQPELVRLHNQGLAMMDQNTVLMVEIVNLSRTAPISESLKAQIEQARTALEELRLSDSRVSFCPVAELAHGYPDLDECTQPLRFARSLT